jgi:hypothetical protein
MHHSARSRFLGVACDWSVEPKPQDTPMSLLLLLARPVFLLVSSLAGGLEKSSMEQCHARQGLGAMDHSLGIHLCRPLVWGR